MSRVCFKRLVHSGRVNLTKKPADKPYRDELDKITPLSQWGKAPLLKGRVLGVVAITTEILVI